MERQNDAGSELRGHAAAIEVQDFDRRIRLAVLRQKALATVVAVVDRQQNRENLDFQHVTGLSTLDIHGAREDMAARALTIAAHLVHDRLSEDWIFWSGTPAFSSPAGVLVNNVSTSMMSPESMRKAGFASDQ